MPRTSKTMKCPTCVNQNKTSKIFLSKPQLQKPDGDIEHYYDEDGNYHIHDETMVVQTYSCTNNHSWSVKSFHKCPVKTCEFNDKIEEKKKKVHHQQ